MSSLIYYVGRALLDHSGQAVVNAARLVRQSVHPLGFTSAVLPTPFCGLPGAAARIATDAATATIALPTELPVISSFEYPEPAQAGCFVPHVDYSIRTHGAVVAPGHVTNLFKVIMYSALGRRRVEFAPQGGARMDEAFSRGFIADILVIAA